MLKSYVKQLKGFFNKLSGCPKCGLPFNSWFVWNAKKYCYPCWSKTGKVIYDPKES